MSYGKKCNIIFIRKVRNRLRQLEERYKDLDPKEKASKINQELASIFCVEPRQITNWKIADRLSQQLKEIDFLETLSPTILIQLNRLKIKDDLIRVANKAIKEKLTVREVKVIINEILGIKPKQESESPLRVYISCPKCKAQIPISSRLREKISKKSPSVQNISSLDLEKVKANLIKEIPSNDNLFHPLLEEWEKLHPYKKIVVRDKTSEELENEQ